MKRNAVCEVDRRPEGITEGRECEGRNKWREAPIQAPQDYRYSRPAGHVWPRSADADCHSISLGLSWRLSVADAKKTQRGTQWLRCPVNSAADALSLSGAVLQRLFLVVLQPEDDCVVTWHPGRRICQ